MHRKYYKDNESGLVMRGALKPSWGCPLMTHSGLYPPLDKGRGWVPKAKLGILPVDPHQYSAQQGE
eukprot:5992859-Karenia_brevis.AAC.1